MSRGLGHGRSGHQPGALATAVAVAGEAGLAFIKPIDGYAALIIGFDGRRRWTRGFPFAPP